MLLQPVEQLVAQKARWRPKTAILILFNEVQRETDAGLPQHFGGRTIAGIAVPGDLDADRLPVGGLAAKPNIEEALLLTFRAGAFTRLGDHKLLQHPAGRWQG